MQDRHRRIVEIFLLRTAGPYIRVKPGKSPIEQLWSAVRPSPDSAQTSRHFSEVPLTDPCSAASATLLDDLIGAGEQRVRHSEAERLGGFEIDR